jgi:hypothetical protein
MRIFGQTRTKPRACLAIRELTAAEVLLVSGGSNTAAKQAPSPAPVKTK